MNTFNRIFIVGHPGSGKAVLAKALAKKIGWQFVDADFGLEIHVGRALTDIIGKTGAQLFYQCESEILTSLLARENIVISTDASIVCNERNREILVSEFVVYLKVSSPVQLERTLRNQEPLLNSDFKTFFDALHVERDILYDEVAKLSIDGDHNYLNEHVTSILKTLSKDQKVPNRIALDKKDFVFYHKKLHTPIVLAKQQAMCLRLLAQGKTSKEIAREMNISYRTVENYITKIMELLGCTSSKELIALYHDQP